MELPRDALLLRIFLGESDEVEGEPVFRKIVLKAREVNLAGDATLAFRSVERSLEMLPGGVPRTHSHHATVLENARRERVTLWPAA